MKTSLSDRSEAKAIRLNFPEVSIQLDYGGHDKLKMILYVTDETG